jgi:hypothetical protein
MMEYDPGFASGIGLAASSFISDLPMVVNNLTGVELPEGIDGFLGFGGSFDLGISIDDTEDPILGVLPASLALVSSLVEDSDSSDAGDVVGLVGNSYGDLIFPAVETVATDIATDIATNALQDAVGPIIAPFAGAMVGKVVGDIAEDIVEDVLTPDDSMDTLLSSVIDSGTGLLGQFL